MLAYQYVCYIKKNHQFQKHSKNGILSNEFPFWVFEERTNSDAI